ncbi:hypothetical protein TL16_g09563 [Triparma laevis f. inornata]|uniref:Myb-like domain-containing protein n=2 Tax=Triparma laevis TaxID=1534972 RepID=A0A9W6ZP53_9STRA|nr:hypothetical protein TrLO_g14354 [Triparma laevis f. longispina]GMH83337.1 hypothetical protein TL16_g09563 [Triparma laevis f. inornata]
MITDALNAFGDINNDEVDGVEADEVSDPRKILKEDHLSNELIPPSRRSSNDVFSSSELFIGSNTISTPRTFVVNNISRGMYVSKCLRNSGVSIHSMKAAAQVEEQPRDVKKVKSVLPEMKTSNGYFAWTAEEEAALVEAVDEYGLDFGRIKAEAGARLGDRKAKALEKHFRDHHPGKFMELRAANPLDKSGGKLIWTNEEDEALKRGRRKHGNDWEKIIGTESEVLGHRTANAIRQRKH